MIKKGRLKEIVKELRAASKMHAGQADEISEHIDDMALPMKSPLNIKKSKSHKENYTTSLPMKSPLNCWKGHERVPGTKEFAKGSCRKK